MVCVGCAYPNVYCQPAGVSEWFKEAVLKTVDVKFVQRFESSHRRYGALAQLAEASRLRREKFRFESEMLYYPIVAQLAAGK